VDLVVFFGQNLVLLTVESDDFISNAKASPRARHERSRNITVLLGVDFNNATEDAAWDVDEFHAFL
jgi:hypothetical protein